MDQQISSFFDGIFKEIVVNIKDPSEFTGKLAMTLILAVFWFICERLVSHLALQQMKDIKALNVFFSISRFLLRLLFVIGVTWIWLNALDALLILVLVGAIFLGLSVKGLISNIVGWLLIINRHHFRVYDRIEIDDLKGEVLSVNPLFFTLMELGNWYTAEAPTGRTVKFPNNIILSKKVTNYNELTPFVWKEIGYLVTFTSDWQKAHQIMLQVTEEYYEEFQRTYFADPRQREKFERQFQLFDGEPSPQKIIDVQEQGVALKIRYPVCYTEGTKVATQLHEKILTAFAAERDIEMAGNRLYISSED